MANLIPQGGVFAGLDRLNQSLDQRAQNAMALSQMREQERRNALSEGYIRDDRERQLAEIQRQETIRNAMSQPYTQQTGGPLLSQMGQDYQPVSLETMQPNREMVGQRLQGLGEWEQALKLMPESSQPEYQIIDGQYVPKHPGQAAMPIPGFQRQDKEPEFTIMQDANGEYVYLPKTPGAPVGSGVKGKMPKERPGMSLQVGPDGTVTFADGTAAPLTKGTTAKTEQDILDTSLSLQKLNGIQAAFKPEFLTVPEKLVQGGVAAYEKLGGKLSPQQRQSLEEYTAFRQQGMELLNSEIKRMTGAAITKQEEPRLRASMPDPQGDGPTEYKVKFEKTIKILKLANARYNYALRRGVAIDATNLDDMPRVINRRGDELEKQLGKQITDKEKLRQEVQLQLAREFGI